MDQLDYLKDLGVTALYLTPIFASASNHRYHPYDYYQVDPLLGGNAALRELLDAALDRGLRVILDGVFNHASRGFWAFHHVLENGLNSPYVDWFIIRGWPLRAYHSDATHPPNYDCWWGLPALPKFNLLAFYRRAIALRHHSPALRTGTFQHLHARDGVYAFARTLPGQCAVVIVNTQTRAATFDVDVSGPAAAETIFEGVWNQGRYAITQRRLHGVTIPAREAVVLVRVEDGAVR